MTIEIIDGEKRHIAFNGVAPTTFDEAVNVLELVLPTKEYLECKEYGE